MSFNVKQAGVIDGSSQIALQNSSLNTPQIENCFGSNSTLVSQSPNGNENYKQELLSKYYNENPFANFSPSINSSSNDEYVQKVVGYSSDYWRCIMDTVNSSTSIEDAQKVTESILKQYSKTASQFAKDTNNILGVSCIDDGSTNTIANKQVEGNSTDKANTSIFSQIGKFFKNLFS